MLTMAISLRRYLHDQVSTDMMTKIENNWLTKHRERLQQTDARTPHQILRVYADDNDLTVADIETQMDWSAWDLEHPNETAKSSTSD